MAVVIWQSNAAAEDYSAVDSRAKAEDLVRRGELVALLMFPELFGADARPENVVYVPKDVAERKNQIDEDIIVPLVESGTPVAYRVTPEHDGSCFVPTALILNAHQRSDPLVYRLAIWGKGRQARKAP